MGERFANAGWPIALVAIAAALGACASAPASRPGAWKTFPNGRMHEAITCPAGMAKQVPATTDMQLFEGLWKAQPEARTKGEIEWVRFKDRGELSNVTAQRGKVIVEMLIGTRGQVLAAHVTCSSNPSLDSSALEIVDNAHYRPAQIAGKPVMSVIKRPVNFRR